MANEIQQEIIGDGVGAWNNWRAAHPDEKIDLSGIDLELANLQEINLTGANLEGANLEGVNLERARLEGARLYGVNLKEADLKNASLNGAQLRRADLKDAYLERAELQKADLKMADLERANFFEADLREAKLERVNLKEADLEGADLRGARLSDSKLQEANLENANCESTIVDGANLGHANLKKASFLYASLKGAKIYGADLEETSFINANLNGVYIYGANLDETDFDGASLDGADLDEDSQKYVLGIEDEDESEDNATHVCFALAPELSFLDTAAVIADLEQLITACALHSQQAMFDDGFTRWARQELEERQLARWLRYQYADNYDQLFSFARLEKLLPTELDLAIDSGVSTGKLLSAALRILGSLKDSVGIVGELQEIIDARKRVSQPPPGGLSGPSRSMEQILCELEETEKLAIDRDEPLALVAEKARKRLQRIADIEEDVAKVIASRIAALCLNRYIMSVSLKEGD